MSRIEPDSIGGVLVDFKAILIGHTEKLLVMNADWGYISPGTVRNKFAVEIILLHVNYNESKMLCTLKLCKNYSSSFIIY